jgi:hypothetical protein
VEFIMLGAPAVLVFVGGATLFINGYLDTMSREVAIDASRHAALADQDYQSARSYLDSQLGKYLSRIKTSASLQFVDGKYAEVDLQYQPFPSLFSLTQNAIQIKVVTPIEIAQ